MKNRAQWKPTEFELHRGRWRGARNGRELGAGPRLIGDRVAALHRAHRAGTFRSAIS